MQGVTRWDDPIPVAWRMLHTQRWPPADQLEAPPEGSGLQEGVPNVVEWAGSCHVCDPDLKDQNPLFVPVLCGPDVPGQREVGASWGRANGNASGPRWFPFVWGKSKS